MKTIQLKIIGMTCPSCSATVERQLNDLDGILDKYINHVTDTGKINFDDTLISEEEIIAKINEGHYKVAGFENITNAIETPVCPTCGQSGQFVSNTVFKSNLKPDFFKQIDRTQKYFFFARPNSFFKPIRSLISCNRVYFALCKGKVEQRSKPSCLAISRYGTSSTVNPC